MFIFPESYHLSMSKELYFSFLLKKKKLFKKLWLKVTLILQNQMINLTPLFSVQLMDENSQISWGLTHNFDIFSLKAKHFFHV